MLAIIATIGAIALPRLDQILERQKLRGAASEMRLAWDTARLEAMRTGQAQVFNCLPGTGTYTVQPLVLQSDTANVGSGATVMLQGGAMAETQSNGFLTSADSTDAQAKELGDEILFVSCNVASDMRAYAMAQDSQSSGAGDINTQTVGQAVIFYPDGSTSTAEVRIQNERGDVRGVQIRGLTGHTRVVDISNVPTSPDDEKKAKG